MSHYLYAFPTLSIINPWKYILCETKQLWNFDDLEIFKSQFHYFTIVESIFLNNIMLMKCGVKPNAT